MSDIQQARDMLAKWRDGTSKGPWVDHHFPSDDEAELTDASGGLLLGAMMANYPSTIAGPDARLIVGTAGNPDLLDAIDGMLRIADTRMARREEPAFVLHAERIAAAITAADERMSS